MLAILAPARIIGVDDAIAASAKFAERRRLARSRHAGHQDPRHRDHATESQATARPCRPAFANVPYGAAQGSYGWASRTFFTTQRCLPILRSRLNPSFS